ncbi:GIY-YIG nuclease family protein [Patescibacteria group bacterium]
MSKIYYVYILGSHKNGVLYTGITSNIHSRLYVHRYGPTSGFSSKYKTYKLFYLEEYEDVGEAIKREKNIKKWYRQWKINLINKNNPEWKDLADELM